MKTDYFFSRFFNSSGGVNDDKMCPVNDIEYPYTDSSVMDNLCNMLGFFIPEGRGGTSKMHLILLKHLI